MSIAGQTPTTIRRYPAVVLRVRSVLVDFDGTACTHDVAEHLLDAFGDPTWRDLDERWERGELGAPEGLRIQAQMLRRPTEELVAFALEHCPMDPTFAPFVRRCREAGIPVTVVSDGFGLYIEPLLRSAGVQDVAVVTNTWIDGGTIAFPNGHPDCINCGTCKMRTVLDAPGPVAFIGEGSSDRYAALYADVVYAKDLLVGHCERDGVPFRTWSNFDDVWRDLAEGRSPPGPVAPLRCLGWMPRSPAD
jgi:2,3-diketo-5-methylthio-1-phosphopentane phosphatase